MSPAMRVAIIATSAALGSPTAIWASAAHSTASRPAAEAVAMTLSMSRVMQAPEQRPRRIMRPIVRELGLLLKLKGIDFPFFTLRAHKGQNISLDRLPELDQK